MPHDQIGRVLLVEPSQANGKSSDAGTQGNGESVFFEGMRQEIEHWSPATKFLCRAPQLERLVTGPANEEAGVHLFPVRRVGHERKMLVTQVFKQNWNSRPEELNIHITEHEALPHVLFNR